MSTQELYGTNKCLVGANASGVTMMLPPNQGELTFDDALSLAAWLVVIAEPYADHKFDEVLAAVRGT